MTEKKFKATKFGYGDKIKVKGIKTPQLIYGVDFEVCAFEIFNPDAKDRESYTRTIHCSGCELL